MASWLQRQRKADLVELADEAGMQGAAINMRKDDLIIALENHLHANASTLYRHPTFDVYFNRIPSPVKREAAAFSSVPSEGAMNSVRSRGRRRISKSPQLETDLETSPEPSGPVVPHSGAIYQAIEPMVTAVQDFASAIPTIPPSPAAVADMVERRTSVAADSVRRYYTSHHIPRYIASFREALSSTYFIVSAFILMEALGLQRATLPWKYAFTLPASRLTNDSQPRVFLPDFFVLLDGRFWSLTTLWATTSILLPALFGYLVNFRLVNGKRRRGGYDVDPLVFNVAKIVVTWLVFTKAQSLGRLFDTSSVLQVGNAITGGPLGMIVGGAIGALFSVYEAVLQK